MILDITDFETGGRFEGLPEQKALELVEFTNSRAAEIQQLHRDLALAGIKASAELNDIDPGIKLVLLEAAEYRVLKDFTFVNGAWRDKAGTAQFNGEGNFANVSDLYFRQLRECKSLQNSTPGASNGGGIQAKANGALPDIAGAKSLVEVDEIIRKHLISQKETPGSKSFADKSLELRQALEVDKMKLPISTPYRGA